MQSRRNEVGGETVWVWPDEELADVPDSHRGLITEEIRGEFENPKGFLMGLSVDVKLPALREYATSLINHAQTSLMLATAEDMFGGPQAAYQWSPWERAKAPHLILLEPGKCDFYPFPAADFEILFSHVRWVHWAELGNAGGLFEPGKHQTVAHWGAPSTNELFPPAATWVFGCSTNGDMLIYNEQGEAGFLSHENGQAYSLGSVTDALNWIFEELRQGRAPEFDDARVK